MPHHPKPWFRESRNTWYVEIGGKQVNLGKDETEAFRQYHEIMSRPELAAPTPTLKQGHVTALLDQFLEWCSRNRAEKTYLSYKERLQSFVDYLRSSVDIGLLVGDLKPIHVHNWVDSHETWNPGMKRGRMQAVQRVFNWAVKMGVIEKSPVRFLDKPPQGKRENVITPAMFKTICEVAKPEPFRLLLIVAWEIGARPQELLRVEAHHFDHDAHRIVLPASEAKGKKRIRVVYLTPCAYELCQGLIADFPTGPIFRNSKNRPWTPYAVNCAFRRVQSKIGHKFALVDFRHSFVQRLLTAGVDAITVSILCGHVDTAMISRVYSHLQQDPEYLKKALERASSAGASEQAD